MEMRNEKLYSRHIALLFAWNSFLIPHFSFLIWREAPLSSQPAFGIEFCCFTAKLELKDVVRSDMS